VPPTKKLTPQEQEIQERRHGIGPHGERAEYQRVEDEFDEWNGMYG
jgi:hypothetical protein